MEGSSILPIVPLGRSVSISILSHLVFKCRQQQNSKGYSALDSFTDFLFLKYVERPEGCGIFAAKLQVLAGP